MVGEITATQQFHSEHGAFWTSLLLLSGIALTFICYHFWKVVREHNEAMKSLSKCNEIIVSVSELLQTHSEGAEQHYRDVERLASDEHWKNCAVDKCPNFGNLLREFNLVVSKLEVYEVGAEKSRVLTNEQLQQIISELLNLSREIIKTIRSLRENGKRRDDDD